jgi:uroporphyrinogen-III synthase
MNVDVEREPDRPLRGRLVVTTRDEAGELERRLMELGARVHHLPLIRIVEIEPGLDADRHRAVGLGALVAALGDLGDDGWLVVTSRHGAQRCREAVLGASLGLRLAAVGAATAAVLAEAGRDVDLVPDDQTSAGLLDAFRCIVDAPQDIVVAQAEQAAPTLVEGLRALGHRVRAVTLYRTELLEPDPEQWSAARAADAVTLMSGTAARAWAAAQIRSGEPIPAPPAGPVICAIGPSTAGVAEAVGLSGVCVANHQSIDAVVHAVVEALGP